MRARRMSALLLLTVLAACGGSGSSGFDIGPGGFEATLIGRAITENRCVEGADDLLICPSGVPVRQGDPTLLGPNELRVDAGFAGEVDCTSDVCMVSLGIAVEGLPAGAVVRVAVRAAGADVWHIGEPLAVSSAGGGHGLETPVVGGAGGDAMAGDEVQVAVLVFVPPLDPVPAEVEELSESGARYAFVLAPVALTPGVSP
ncbi:MAG: hypothetical protein FJ148_21985 [Deltaproteobacteria bacterium]|nr:hypothetical protein [Deltaproteobacteria bacterium]